MKMKRSVEAASTAWLFTTAVAVVAATGAAATGAAAELPSSMQDGESPQVSADRLVGSWQGTLVAGPQKLGLAVEVALDESGGYTGEFFSLMQSKEGIPIASVTRDGDVVVFDVQAIRARYEAVLHAAADGATSTLVGTWHQSGAEFPLTLTAVEEVTEPKRPQTPSEPFPYSIEEVAFSHGDVTLAGTLTLPSGVEGKHAVAVLISGSGPQDRDETLVGHKPFWVLADHLSRAGLGVLRFDDRGVGGSTGDFDSATSRDFADDVVAALRYLRGRDDVDHARLGMIGHSEGGLIAPMVAADPKSQDLVAFAVLLAPPAVNIRDVILHQHEQIAIATGEMGTTAYTANRHLLKEAFALVQKHEDPKVCADAIRSVAEAAWQEIASAEEASEDGASEEGAEGAGGEAGFLDQALSLAEPWMRYLLGYDPAVALRSMQCDVLVLFGGKDLQVDPAQNQAPLEQAFRDGKVAAKVEVLKGHNHLFQRSESGSPFEYGDLEETFSPVALDAVAGWIRDTVLVGRSK